jgi:formylglycine-generating enzyme required for sulfatase activity
MKKFKLSAMLIYMMMLVFSACGGGGGGGSDDPGNPGAPVNPDDPNSNEVLNYTLPSGTYFNMTIIPDISTTKTFPIGMNDSGSANVPARFIMGETEVTYELWKEVYDWATSAERGADKYTFANAGRQGGNYTDNNPVGTTQHPVTEVNLRDMIVWCNALTEYCNANKVSETILAVVYCSDSSFTTPIRDSVAGDYDKYLNSTAGSFDNPYVNSFSKGFRLPTSNEWEFAARYIGTSVPLHTNYVLKDGIYYTKGNSASGATDYAYNTAVNPRDNTESGPTRSVGWYSSYTPLTSTHSVKLKKSNALGLYDMSGNVLEVCFDWHPDFMGYSRICRGGIYNSGAELMQVGFVGGFYPMDRGGNSSFRICRSW